MICLSAGAYAFRLGPLRSISPRLNVANGMQLGAATMLPTDDEMEEWLDDMVFSGDIRVTWYVSKVNS